MVRQSLAVLWGTESASAGWQSTDREPGTFRVETSRFSAAMSRMIPYLGAICATCPSNCWLTHRTCSQTCQNWQLQDVGEQDQIYPLIAVTYDTIKGAGMSTIMIGSRSQLEPVLLNSIHDFRKEVFVSRLGWSLPLMEGSERDQYDRNDTVYVTVSDAHGRVTACSRLLPTTGSYMLPELFPALLGGASPPSDPAIWELSRFATNVRATGEGRVLSLSKPTLHLLELVFAFARQSGIERLLLVTTVGIERLMLRSGLEAHRVGPPVLTGGSPCVALFLEVPAKPIEEAIH
jgi:acyl homoserine lactone synthase